LNRGIRNLLTIFDVSGTFRYRLVGQHLPDAPRDIATLTFDLDGDGPSRRYGPLTLEVTALTVDAGLRTPSVYQY